MGGRVKKYSTAFPDVEHRYVSPLMPLIRPILRSNARPNGARYLRALIFFYLYSVLNL